MTLRSRYGAPNPSFDEAFRSQLLTLLRGRHDVRCFQSTPVDAGAIVRLLETATLAPSVGLSQPWRFVLVHAPERRAAIRPSSSAAMPRPSPPRQAIRGHAMRASSSRAWDEAPCQLAVFADPEPRQGHGLGRQTMPETTAYSAVMAVHTLWLAARAEGLGLGWVSILEPAVVSEILAVPSDWTLIGYLCVGYPQIETEMPELQSAGWGRRAPNVPLLQR